MKVSSSLQRQPQNFRQRTAGKVEIVYEAISNDHKAMLFDKLTMFKMKGSEKM